MAQVHGLHGFHHRLRHRADSGPACRPRQRSTGLQGRHGNLRSCRLPLLLPDIRAGSRKQSAGIGKTGNLKGNCQVPGTEYALETVRPQHSLHVDRLLHAVRGTCLLLQILRRKHRDGIAGSDHYDNGAHGRQSDRSFSGKETWQKKSLLHSRGRTAAWPAGDLARQPEYQHHCDRCLYLSLRLRNQGKHLLLHAGRSGRLR